MGPRRQADVQPDLRLAARRDRALPADLVPQRREHAVGGPELEDGVLDRGRAEVADGDRELPAGRGTEPGQHPVLAFEPDAGEHGQARRAGLGRQLGHRVVGDLQRGGDGGLVPVDGGDVDDAGAGLGRGRHGQSGGEASVVADRDRGAVGVGAAVGAADHVLSADQQHHQGLGPPAGAGDGDLGALRGLLERERHGGLALGAGGRDRRSREQHQGAHRQQGRDEGPDPPPTSGPVAPRGVPPALALTWMLPSARVPVPGSPRVRALRPPAAHRGPAGCVRGTARPG